MEDGLLQFDFTRSDSSLNNIHPSTAAASSSTSRQQQQQIDRTRSQHSYHPPSLFSGSSSSRSGVRGAEMNHTQSLTESMMGYAGDHDIPSSPDHLTSGGGDGDSETGGAVDPIVGKRSATVRSSTFNLTNTVIGSGMLALPYAFRLCGVILGGIFLFTVAGLGVFSTHLLVRSMTLQTNGRFDRVTYANLASQTLGKFGVLASNLSMALACFGAGASYLVIMADLITPIIAALGDWSEKSVDRSYIILSVLVFIVPLSLLRRLDSLRFASIVSLFSVAYLVLVIVVEGGKAFRDRAFETCPGGGDCVVLAKLSRDFLRSIPILAFGFTCHPSFPPIVQELRAPTPGKLRTITSITFGTSGFVYLLVGSMGYFTFFQQTKSNILTNYEEDRGPHIWIAMGGISLSVLLSFPILALPLYMVTEETLFGATPGDPVRPATHVGVVLSLITLQVLISIFVEDVAFIFGLVGATASTMISFILPAAFYIRTKQKFGMIRWRSPSFLGAVALLVCGMVFMVIATTITIMDYGKEDEEENE